MPNLLKVRRLGAVAVRDRVILSTQYRGVANVSGSNSVPDWPGHSAYEYPIGLHLVTAIARTGS